MQTDSTRTNYQFKLIYAIGIFMVVANHLASNGGISLFYEFFPAYGFHMPLFIFASGYLYRESAEEHPLKYIWKKIRTLIIPMYLYNFAYALFAQWMGTKGFTICLGITAKKLFLDPLIDGQQFGYNLASWFVAPLFMVQVWNVLFRKCLSRVPEKLKEILILVISCALGMVGMWIASHGYQEGYWLVLNRLLHFMVFYSAGFFYKKVLEQYDKLPNLLYFLLVIGAQFIIILWKGAPPMYQVILCNFKEFSPLPFITGFLGIAFWLRITRLLEPSLGRSKVVNLLADNTFAIMENHFLGFFLVKWIYSLVATYSDKYFQDFNFNAFHSNLWYNYKPFGLSQTIIIYVLVGLTLPLGIQWILNQCKKIPRSIVQNVRNKKAAE